MEWEGGGRRKVVKRERDGEKEGERGKVEEAEKQVNHAVVEEHGQIGGVVGVQRSQVGVEGRGKDKPPCAGTVARPAGTEPLPRPILLIY